MSDIKKLIESIDRISNEPTMANAAKHKLGAKFGGYWKGTDSNPPKPGMGVGADESDEHLTNEEDTREKLKPKSTHTQNCMYHYGHDCNCNKELTHDDFCPYHNGHDCECGLELEEDKAYLGNPHIREEDGLDPPGYAQRVAELEDEGLTTSDAQGVADMEYQLKIGTWKKEKEVTVENDESEHGPYCNCEDCYFARGGEEICPSCGCLASQCYGHEPDEKLSPISEDSWSDGQGQWRSGPDAWGGDGKNAWSGSAVSEDESDMSDMERNRAIAGAKVDNNADPEKLAIWWSHYRRAIGNKQSNRQARDYADRMTALEPKFRSNPFVAKKSMAAHDFIKPVKEESVEDITEELKKAFEDYVSNEKYSDDTLYPTKNKKSSVDKKKVKKPKVVDPSVLGEGEGEGALRLKEFAINIETGPHESRTVKVRATNLKVACKLALNDFLSDYPYMQGKAYVNMAGSGLVEDGIEDTKKYPDLDEPEKKDASVLGEGVSAKEIGDAIAYRITRQKPELITKYGLETLTDAINHVAWFHAGDDEELGTSDIGTMVRQVVRDLEIRQFDEVTEEHEDPNSWKKTSQRDLSKLAQRSEEEKWERLRKEHERDKAKEEIKEDSMLPQAIQLFHLMNTNTRQDMIKYLNVIRKEHGPEKSLQTYRMAQKLKQSNKDMRSKEVDEDTQQINPTTGQVIQQNTTSGQQPAVNTATPITTPQTTAQQPPAPAGSPTAIPAPGQPQLPKAGQAGGAPVAPPAGTPKPETGSGVNTTTTPIQGLATSLQQLAQPGAQVAAAKAAKALALIK